MANIYNVLGACAAICIVTIAPRFSVAQDNDFRPIFDGRSLDGWETSDPSYWTVEDGAITARISAQHPCSVNQYLVWQASQPADFELQLLSRVTGEGGINNGFQFRSRLLPDHDICGYQVDNNLATPWLVRLYDEYGRHTLAMRGQRTRFDLAGRATTEPIEEAEGQPWFRLEDWHQYHLICVGPQITLRVDGRLAAEVVDHDQRRQELAGVLALQLHGGPPTVAQFKDIRLKLLTSAPPVPPNAPPADKRLESLRQRASAWWPLDTGGHGARPALRHIPPWEQFELNVRAEGPAAHPTAKVVLLDGAHFEAGPDLPLGTDQLTVLVRARDPRAAWQATLLSKRDGQQRVAVHLFSGDRPQTQGPNIGLQIQTQHGLVSVSFPISRIDATAWHDFVGRYDGKTLDLFCDGRLMASAVCRGEIAASSAPLLIGAERDGDHIQRQFHGEMELVGVWAHALSDEEIAALSAAQTAGVSHRLRLIVETDAGGDPDDEQSLVRFLLYTNDFDVEGILANRAEARDGENLNRERTGLGIVRALVRAYGQCFEKLSEHDARYPTAERLAQVTVAGFEDSDDAVQLVIDAVDREDSRPVWFLNWGTDHGSAPSALKLALDRVQRERGADRYAEFKQRLRLSSDDQFGQHTSSIAPPFPLWVDTFRPELDRRRWYHQFSALTATAGGFDLKRDVLTGHGPLGALYPTNTTHPQKEGDTMSFLYLVPTGMNDPNQPTWGSWAGRYGPRDDAAGRAYFWANQQDAWQTSTHRDNTLSRWAADLQNDFRARLDWCAKSITEANHPPQVVVNGDTTADIIALPSSVGSTVELDAAGSNDPDGDAMRYLWFVYPEAGSYRGAVSLSNADGQHAQLGVPELAAGKTIHIILRIVDDGDPPLARYRRVIVTVVP